MKLVNQFADVDGSNLFYRTSGSGPTVLVIHQSPQSSLASIKWIDALRESFQVIAPDTPGYGYSDSLSTDNPTIEDFAQKMLAFCQQLGLKKYAVIGTHTGAAIAAKMCVLSPETITAAVFDGFPAFNSAEQLELGDRYLTPFNPSWDGSHLAWLWSRIREQTIFFPWYQTDQAHRMTYDCRDAEGMHQWAIDFLMAGASYSKAYAAAFQQDGVSLSGEINVPSLFYYFKHDPLSTHAPRLKLKTKDQQLEFLSLEDCHFRRVLNYLSDRLKDVEVQSISSPALSTNGGLKIFSFDHSADNNQIGTFSYNHQAAKTRVWLPDFTQNIESMRERIHPFSIAVDGSESQRQEYNEVILDLPGHGLTEVDSDLFSPDAFASVIHNQLKLEPSMIVAEGASLAYALALSARSTHCKVIGINAYLMDNKLCEQWHQNALPDLTPSWNGAHLHAAWQASRLSRLFWPWYQTDKEHMILGEPHLSDQSVANQALNWLNCYQQLPELVYANRMENHNILKEQDVILLFSENHPTLKIAEKNIPKKQYPEAEIWRQCYQI